MEPPPCGFGRCKKVTIPNTTAATAITMATIFIDGRFFLAVPNSSFRAGRGGGAGAAGAGGLAARGVDGVSSGMASVLPGDSTLASNRVVERVHRSVDLLKVTD